MYVGDTFSFVLDACMDFVCCVLWCLHVCVCVGVCSWNLESRFLEFEGEDLKIRVEVGKSG